MDHDLWNDVDTYIAEVALGADPALDAALKAADDAGLPPIAVSPAQGKFLQILAAAIGARRILEIGTLGGYSTIWLAGALPPGGKLVTLELDPGHAEIARANLERAGFSEAVEVRVGRALDSLEELVAEGVEPFDLVFIDADKPNTPEYFTTSVGLTRPGGVIVVDNVVREGAVADASSDDPAVTAMRRFLYTLAASESVDGTVIQTVGAKGYDGFAIARVSG